MQIEDLEREYHKTKTEYRDFRAIVGDLIPDSEIT